MSDGFLRTAKNVQRRLEKAAARGDYASLRARVARLEGALPDPDKLEILARWFDLNFGDNRNPEVQTDLRNWAKKIRNVLEEK